MVKGGEGRFTLLSAEHCTHHANADHCTIIPVLLLIFCTCSGCQVIVSVTALQQALLKQERVKCLSLLMTILWASDSSKWMKISCVASLFIKWPWYEWTPLLTAISHILFFELFQHLLMVLLSLMCLLSIVWLQF